MWRLPKWQALLCAKARQHRRPRAIQLAPCLFASTLPRASRGASLASEFAPRAATPPPPASEKLVTEDLPRFEVTKLTWATANSCSVDLEARFFSFNSRSGNPRRGRAPVRGVARQTLAGPRWHGGQRATGPAAAVAIINHCSYCPKTRVLLHLRQPAGAEGRQGGEVGALRTRRAIGLGLAARAARRGGARAHRSSSTSRRAAGRRKSSLKLVGVSAGARRPNELLEQLISCKAGPRAGFITS